MAARAERQPRLGIEPGEARLSPGRSPCSSSNGRRSHPSVAETFSEAHRRRASLIMFLVNSFLLAGTSVAVGRLAARADQRLLLRVLVLLGLLLLPPGCWSSHGRPARAFLLVGGNWARSHCWCSGPRSAGSSVGGRKPGLITAGGTLGTSRQLRLGAARAGVRHPRPCCRSPPCCSGSAVSLARS